MLPLIVHSIFSRVLASQVHASESINSGLSDREQRNATSQLPIDAPAKPDRHTSLKVCEYLHRTLSVCAKLAIGITSADMADIVQGSHSYSYPLSISCKDPPASVGDLSGKKQRRCAPEGSSPVSWLQSCRGRTVVILCARLPAGAERPLEAAEPPLRPRLKKQPGDVYHALLRTSSTPGVVLPQFTLKDHKQEHVLQESGLILLCPDLSPQTVAAHILWAHMESRDSVKIAQC